MLMCIVVGKDGNTARHLDIRLLPKSSEVFGRLFFTSGGDFNQVMRQRAKEMGMLLNETGLYSVDENGKVGDIVFTEKELKKSSRIKISTNYNQAILDADKLLDKALKIKGFTGTTGEKMKRANPLFTHRNEVWAAHKLRNRIAHELNITITEKQFKATLHQFKTGLKDLGLNLK